MIFRTLLSILFLFITINQIHAEYQYRPVGSLNEVYELEVSASKIHSFELEMKAYQNHIFSNPDSAFIVIEKLKKLKSSVLYDNFLSYLKAKAHSAKSEYDQAYIIIVNVSKLEKMPLSFKGDVLLLFGRICRYKNDLATTLKLYDEARRIFTSSEDFMGLAIVEVNLAEYYRASTEFDKAQRHINIAYNLIKDSKLPDLIEVYRLNRKAAIYSQIRKLDSAILLTNETILLAKKLDNKFLLASGLNELGVLYDFSKNYDKSKECFIEAIRLWKETGHMRYWTEAVHNLARFYVTNGEHQACNLLIQEHLPLVKEKKWNGVLGTYYGVLSRSSMAQKDYEKSFYWAELNQLAIRADVESRVTKELAVQEAVFELEKKQEQVELLKSEKERNTRQRNLAILIAIIVGALLIYVARLESVKRKINTRLSKSLNEREILIKEIHHRVKNNLQVIASLLYLQSDDTENINVKRMLEEGQGRVRSMALIHQKLYENDDLRSIPFEEYLEELIGEIQKTFGQQAESVQLRISAKDIFFDVDTAVPLGLIINELSTNAFKYAYLKHPGGTFNVNLIKEGDSGFHMQVSDNGVGIPDEHLNASNSKSLGLKLTKMLSDQLEGDYKFSNSNGTIFDLKFVV